MTNDRQFVANLPFFTYSEQKQSAQFFFIIYLHFILCKLIKNKPWTAQRLLVKKIKSLRETKEISVAELAVRSGLAEEQIERIENNVDLPSLAPLIKIARALGVRLGTFLDDQEEQGAVICRKQESEDTISFSNNAMDLRTHMRYHSLSKSKADRHMEPFIVDVEPTEESHFSLSSHEGEEFIYVMEGAVEVCHGKKCHLIKAGDSIYYDSIVPHHVHGYQGQAAKILAVIYTPI